MPETYFDPRDGDDTLRSYEAEKAVFGALLLDNGTRSIVDGVLEAADFSDPQHRTIFNVDSRMLDAGDQVDVNCPIWTLFEGSVG